MMDEIVQHAESQAPAEACGLIGGCASVGTQLFRTDNIDVDPHRYEIDPAQMFRALMAIDEAGLDLVAIYHSHPASPAWPSPTDVAFAFYPESFYVIVSLLRTEARRARAFRIVEGVVTEHALLVT